MTSKTRKTNPNSLANLKDKSAPDKPGDVTPITVQVTTKQKEWLDAQPESRSYHVRQALAEYLIKKQRPGYFDELEFEQKLTDMGLLE